MTDLSIDIEKDFNDNEDFNKQNINSAVASLRARLEDMINENNEINLGNITGIAINLMVIVQTFHKLTGAMKKEVIITTLTGYINNKVEDNKLRTDLLAFVAVTLPPLIDSIIDVATGRIKIKTPNWLKSIFRFCGCRMKTTQNM